jgi:hypothetical protein
VTNLRNFQHHWIPRKTLVSHPNLYYPQHLLSASPATGKQIIGFRVQPVLPRKEVQAETDSYLHPISNPSTQPLSHSCGVAESTNGIEVGRRRQESFEPIETGGRGGKRSFEKAAEYAFMAAAFRQVLIAMRARQGQAVRGLSPKARGVCSLVDCCT